jgi:hypothetical protein
VLLVLELVDVLDVVELDVDVVELDVELLDVDV